MQVASWHYVEWHAFGFRKVEQRFGRGRNDAVHYTYLVLRGQKLTVLGDLTKQMNRHIGGYLSRKLGGQGVP